MTVAKAKPTKKKTGKSSKAPRGKKKEEATFGLPSDEDLEKEAKALDKKKLERENTRLRKELETQYGFGNITGGIPVRPRTVLVATIVGVGSTLLSSLGPSKKVRSITPVEALREGAGFTPTGMTRRLLVGSGVTVVGVALLAVGMLTNLGTRSSQSQPARE